MAIAPASVTDVRDDDDDDDAPAPIAHLFATETMAELSARQGRIADALAIYRHLLGGLDPAAPDDERRQRWTDRVALLEQTPPSGAGRAARAPASRIPGSARTATATGAPPAGTGAGARPGGAPVAHSHLLPMVIRQPVRSGQIVYAERGDLIVMAPVNPGAQVIADGNIHVYSALRGRAVAGVRGAADAQVFCLALEAELIGVDVGYVPSAEIPAALWGKPSRAFLRDGLCVIEGLTTTAGPPVSKAAETDRAPGGWRWRRKPV